LHAADAMGRSAARSEVGLEHRDPCPGQRVAVLALAHLEVLLDQLVGFGEEQRREIHSERLCGLRNGPRGYQIGRNHY
jgi:hypothetical protein